MTHPLHHQMSTYLTSWEEKRDRRAVFLACYEMMTRNMFAAVEGETFHDRDWVRDLIHNFAAYYFVSLEGYDQRGLVSAVWQRVHDLTSDPSVLVLQHLLLGVNAHINYDLVLVLVDMLEPHWAGLDLDQRQRFYEDYCHVNHVICATIDRVQDEVVERYAPGMDLIDRFCGPLDEWGTSRLIRAWRADVWRQAVAMMEAPDHEARLLARQAVEEAAMHRAALLVDGGERGARIFRYPLRWLRWLETFTVV